MARDRSRRLDEGIEAARAAAPEMSRAEVRARLVAELLMRDIVMTPPDVDLILRGILLDDGVSGKMRRTVWQLASAAEATGGVIRVLNAAVRHQPLPPSEAGGARFLRPDRNVQADVILDPPAQQFLAAGKPAITDHEISVLGGDTIEVWLGSPSSAHSDRGPGRPAEDQPVAVYYGEERVGILGPEASDAYRPAVCDAYDAGVIPVIPATRSQTSDGLRHLRLGHPVPRRYR